MPAAKKTSSSMETLPLVPLRDVVIYPYMVIPLFVGREQSIKAIDVASKKQSYVFLTSQKDGNVDDPKKTDLYTIGTVATILQMLKLPDGTIKVLVEGVQRAKMSALRRKNGMFEADVTLIEDTLGADELEVEVLVRSLKSEFEEYVKLNKRIPPEILTPLDNIATPSRLADMIASHLPIALPKKQKILEASVIKKRLEGIIQGIEGEVDLIQIEKRVKGRVKRQMEKSQREYYLNEQIKAIQNELGELGDGASESEELLEKIKSSGMTEEAEEKCMQELSKLKLMPPMSAEATVCRNYLDWMVGLPWNKASKLKADLRKAETLLDEEHYGLEKVKERIIEFLAVQQRVEKLKGPILCLVGPPGVGKTSLGQSIANATGRTMVRMALGGVRDEAEIRGHRKTYIGAMPGKIIQKISKAAVNNPFFLLDEVDKMAMDFRGDPASALLEVLDPEQNATFNDHYLEVDYDLSDVMFVATANTLDIPPALKDRMEVIRISGYTEDEKVNIATRHLIPKQMKANGLKSSELKLSAAVARDIVRYFTREAGVRNLEREISKICRKVVKEILTSKKKLTRVGVTTKNLEDYLGVRRYRYGLAENFDQIGQVTGLAWTEVGGELLRIEAAVTSGKGKTKYTGSLGNVMQESIHAAMTVVRSRAESLGIEEDFFEKHDIHIHVPEGATPKDGPSAGIGMCTALVSVIAGFPVKSDVAMTGEITLRGEVLPIGGLKEKLLAAHRGKVKRVVIPEENRKDLLEIPKNILADLEVIPVKWVDEVLDIALAGFSGKGGKKRSKKKMTRTSSQKKSRRGTAVTH